MFPKFFSKFVYCLDLEQAHTT